MLRLTLLLSCLFLVRSAPAQQVEWPAELLSPWGRVVIYQPQLDGLDGNTLKGRSAVSVSKAGSSHPKFGAIWFEARLEADRAAGVVNLIDVIITEVRFPEATPQQIEEFRKYISKTVTEHHYFFPYEGLKAAVTEMGLAAESAQNLKHDPPAIHYATHPTVLVLVDGEPQRKTVEGTEYEYVVNTPFIMLRDKSGRWFVKGGPYIFKSAEHSGPWTPDPNPPKDVLEIAKQAEGENSVPVDGDIQDAPHILVSTVPAELIEVNGEPQWIPIPDTNLLFLQNSENDVFMRIDSQTTMALLSGRWYETTSLAQGADWKHIPPEKVPGDFAALPTDSTYVHIRSSVPGTDEAREAMIENQIPDTATIDKSQTKVEVTYDGEPKFIAVEERDYKYAANTDKAVFEVDGQFYCCFEGVWFAGPGPKGPWQVCDDVPDKLYTIPPSNPHYNVTYVRVYDSTPTHVYIGCYPGYYGSYMYGPCVVWGTGYYYRPWYGSYYYPHHATWGFSVRYSPYGGWGFGFSYSTGGWFNMTIGFGGYYPYGGMWGAGGYRYGYRSGYHHGYRAGYGAGYRAGYHAGQRDQARKNVYRQNRPGVQPARTTPDRQTRDRMTSDRQAPDRSRTETTKRTGQRSNNIYTDRSGDVYRKQGDSWQKRSNDGWRQERSQPKTREMNRSSQQRNRPSQRPSSVNRGSRGGRRPR